MTRPFVIITIILVSLSAFSGTRTYYPKDRHVTFESEGKRVSLEIEPEYTKLTHDVPETENMSLEQTRLHYERNIGSDIPEIHAALFEDILIQLNEQSKDSEELFCHLLNFTNELLHVSDPKVSRDSFYYSPYELMLIGPSTEKQASLLLGGLMSAACFSVEYAKSSNQNTWSLFIPPTNAMGEEMYDGEEVYEWNGRPTNFVKTGDGRPLSATMESLANTIAIQSSCVVRRKYRRRPATAHCKRSRFQTGALPSQGVDFQLAGTQRRQGRIVFELRGGRFVPRVLKKWHAY